MNKLIKCGILLIPAGAALLLVTFIAGFKACFKTDCNEESFVVLGILALVVLATGLLLLFIGVAKMVLADRRKSYWLGIVFVAYILLGFGTYYYFLGGNHSFEARGFEANFKTPYYTATNLPEGYSESYTSYFSEKESGVYGSGNYSKTNYTKTKRTSDGTAYSVTISLAQSDQPNHAGVLKYCGEKVACDTIDGQRVKNIQCQKQESNSHLCSAQYNGTYLSVSGEHKELSREDSIRILDSLTEK